MCKNNNTTFSQIISYQRDGRVVAFVDGPQSATPVGMSIPHIACFLGGPALLALLLALSGAFHESEKLRAHRHEIVERWQRASAAALIQRRWKVWKAWRLLVAEAGAKAPRHGRLIAASATGAALRSTRPRRRAWSSRRLAAQ